MFPESVSGMRIFVHGMRTSVSGVRKYVHGMRKSVSGIPKSGFDIRKSAFDISGTFQHNSQKNENCPVYRITADPLGRYE